jgi:hypothetical protein
MGAIMAIGVAVANAILLVTFAERSRVRRRERRRAAAEGASSRLRPILMTSLRDDRRHDSDGDWPRAKAAPRPRRSGRAVIGGLIGATLATLGVLPAIFALLQRDTTRKSASLHPADRLAHTGARSSQSNGENGQPAADAPRRLRHSKRKRDAIRRQVTLVAAVLVSLFARCVRGSIAADKQCDQTGDGAVQHRCAGECGGAVYHGLIREGFRIPV